MPTVGCNNCPHKYLKDLFDDSSEIVYICKKTNEYLGYPDELNEAEPCMCPLFEVKENNNADSD